jgi:hypothetical protein
MNTKRKLAAIPAGILCALIASHTAPIQAADSFVDAFKQGKGGLKFRYRLENVDQDNYEKDATASTLRTRLNFRTDDLHGFSVFAEYDFVMSLGWNDYNAGAGNTPNRGEYPVIADPTGSDLNQAYVQWRNDKGTLVRGGRERIIYDNARFVGNVGWRQNEQTYDGAYFQQKVGTFDLQGAWVGQVNRIFGHDVPAGTHDNNTWLLNGSTAWDGVGKLTAYYYDINNKDVASFSTSTYGFRFAGSRDVGGIALGYAGEYARQNDAHNNPVDYDANYYRFDLSMGFAAATPYIGFESLGGDDMRAGAMFRTPLATLHAFNGWADKFLVTPSAGLNDFFFGVKGKVQKWSWNLVYHNFDAESGTANFGKEFDASIKRKFAEHYGVLFKAAWFDGARSSVYDDTTKFWVQLTAEF